MILVIYEHIRLRDIKLHTQAISMKNKVNIWVINKGPGVGFHFRLSKMITQQHLLFYISKLYCN